MLLDIDLNIFECVTFKVLISFLIKKKVSKCFPKIHKITEMLKFHKNIISQKSSKVYAKNHCARPLYYLHISFSTLGRSSVAFNELYMLLIKSQ